MPTDLGQHLTPTVSFRLRALHNATREIGLLNDEQAICDAVIAHTRAGLDVDAAIVLLFMPPGAADLTLVAATEHPGAESTIFPAVPDAHVDVHCIVHTGRAIDATALTSDAAVARQYDGFAFAPVHALGHVLGVLGVRRRAATLSAIETEYFCGLAGVAAVALAQARSRAEALHAERRRALLARYFSPQVATHLLAADDVEPIRATRCDATVLFSDIRGFTALTEHRDPAEVLELLNVYFGVLTDVVFAHGGTVDKLLGDGLLAVFGAPHPLPEHARTALRCAQAMHTAVAGLNLRRFNAQGLGMGIGLHSGPVIAGNVGGERFLEFTVLGATVNLAARIESLTRVFDAEILASEATIRLAGAGVQTEPLAPQMLRGVEQPVLLHRVLSIGDAMNGEPP